MTTRSPPGFTDHDATGLGDRSTSTRHILPCDIYFSTSSADCATKGSDLQLPAMASLEHVLVSENCMDIEDINIPIMIAKAG